MFHCPEKFHSPRDLRAALTAFVIVLVLVIATQGAHAQTFTVIHDFSGTDGYSPYATLTLDTAGNLYGTTAASLTGEGTAFSLKPSHGGWVLNTLVAFSGGDDGGYPYGGVVFSPSGALYGTTTYGGLLGYGVVYSLRPPNTVCKSVICGWTETVVHSFSGSDGNGPYLENLVFDHSGNLYGTTSNGGVSNHGVVFQMTRSGGTWNEIVLHSFLGGNDGSFPASGVIVDAAGNLYGTTGQGGGSGCGGTGCGTVYQLSPSGSGWKETILYSFQGGNDGQNPYGGVILDPSGNLYGTTSDGGSGGSGTVFELSPASGNWTFALLYSLSGGCCAGSLGNLAMDGAGNLYGTAYSTGDGLSGSVFKLKRSDSGWTYITLHNFGYRGPDGDLPVGGPTVDANGNVYGTTSDGGTHSCGFEVTCGVVWEITP